MLRQGAVVRRRAQHLLTDNVGNIENLHDSESALVCTPCRIVRAPHPQNVRHAQVKVAQKVAHGLSAFRRGKERLSNAA